jgi:hypothetical protein
MVIEFDKNVFDSTDFKGINFLLQLCTYKNRYEVFVEFAFGIENTLIFKELHYDDQELLRQIYNSRVQAQNSGSGDIIVTPNYVVCKNPTTDRQLNIEEAIRFLIQPVSIILENSKNDSYFVEAIFKHFNNSGKLLTHLENGWIRFENAGGYRNVSNCLKGLLKSYDDLAARNNREKIEYFRGIVLLDSDKNEPTEPMKQQYINLLSEFISIIFHILEKRAMENYMPIEVFEDLRATIILNKKGHNNWQKMIDWIDAYLNLTERQKDFINISSGFPKHYDESKSIRKSINPNILTFFNVLQDGNNINFKILDEGFVYKGKEFKNEFPLLFLQSARVNKHTLNNRCGTQELQQILEKIYKLL